VSDPKGLADGDIDALVPAVAVDGGRLRLTVSGSPRARVVANALTLRDPSDLALLAAGVTVDGAVRATDVGGFSIDGERAVVWDLSDAQVSIARPALQSLLARAVAAVLDRRDDLAATADDDTWTALEALAVSLRS
jgi:hypothetical protein